jgi:hypothetical protein
MNTNTSELEAILRLSVGEQIEVIQEGADRYVVFTPFTYEDGDHFNIVLKEGRNNGNWEVTDEGATLLHLSYWMDYEAFRKGTRSKIIDRVISQFGLQNQHGELLLFASGRDIGHALFTFIQAITRILDITYLSREQARSTFLEDFRSLMQQTITPDRLTFDYYDPRNDAQKKYKVDARINSMEVPLFVFAIPNDDRCRDVTISLHTFNKWNLQFDSIAIFQDQTDITRDVLARFSDVADKQFSSLDSSNIEIATYLRKKVR